MKRMLMAIAAVSFATAGFADGIDFRKGFSQVAEKAVPAVVFIQVEKEIPYGGMEGPFFNNPFDFFGEEFQQRFFGERRPQRRSPRQGRKRMFRQEGQGSGFIVSKDGYILTNTHVVGDVDKITVKLNDGKEYTAKKIGADPKTEVAVIKIDADKDLPYLASGDPEKLQIGEWVVAIGNPFGLKETLTVGVVSAKGRTGMGITDYEDFIQTDAAINPGNSGGPLLNIDGEVVGINTAIYSRSGGNMGIGFVVPIDMAEKVKEQLVANGKVTRGYVGVMLNPGEVTQELAESFGAKEAGGVLIAEALKDGPAEKAGIKEGDIIVELNGEKIRNNTQFRNRVARIMPNEKAKVVLFRDGKKLEKTLTVAAYPDDDGESQAEGAENTGDILGKLGLEVQPLKSEIAEQLGVDAKEGVVIADVEAGSPAQRAGLSAGMVVLEVNRKPVKTVAAFEKALRQAKGKNALLRVKTAKGAFFANLVVKE